MATKNQLALVEALLDTLVPGDGKLWPSAAGLGLASIFISEAAIDPGSKVFEGLLTALPGDFVTQAAGYRRAALEQQPTDLVNSVAAAAFRAYYSHAAVLRIAAEISAQA